MKLNRVYLLSIVPVLAILFSASPAKAWNCDNPLEGRYDIGSKLPAGTTAGDGDGQYYRGPDAKNPNDYYVCKPVQPNNPPAKPGNTLNQSQTQNQNQSINNSGNSSSKSSSSSSATGGSVKNSGNSSNTNTNTATGGAGGAGGSSTASVDGVGNGSNNTSYADNSSSTYKEIRQNPGVNAPDIFSNNLCAGSISGGVSTPFASIAGGGTKIDKGCDSRAEAEQFKSWGNIRAAAGIACSTDAVKRAIKAKTLTMEECLINNTVVKVVVIEKPIPVPAAVPNITVVIPAPTPAPVAPPVDVKMPTLHSTEYTPCDLTPSGKLSNVCLRQLDGIAKTMLSDESAILLVKGAHEAATTSVELRKRGVVTKGRVDLDIQDDMNSTVIYTVTTSTKS